MSISIPFSSKLYKARFIERPNKFILRCILEDESQIIEAHLPDPGRLKELLIPGCRVWLRKAAGVKRKTEWSAVLCQVPGGDILVSLDSTFPNRLVGKALKEGALTELAGWSMEKPEYVYGGSRWDFFLTDALGRKCFLEVKSVTLVENGVALFPDAVTARGAKHLHELAQLAQEKDTQAALLFIGQREDIDCIRPATHIDPHFASQFARAVEAGVKIFGRKCLVSTTEIGLGEQVVVIK
jgi:sugar fermentation stimulation protein A